MKIILTIIGAALLAANTQARILTNTVPDVAAESAIIQARADQRIALLRFNEAAFIPGTTTLRTNTLPLASQLVVALTDGAATVDPAANPEVLAAAVRNAAAACARPLVGDTALARTTNAVNRLNAARAIAAP